MVEKKGTIWEGTAAELLGQLTLKTPEHITRRKDWFAKPRQVSDSLRRLAPALRRVGVDVQFLRHGHNRTRLIQIERVSASASSASFAGPDLNADPADAGADAGHTSSADPSAHPLNVYGTQDAADEPEPQSSGESHDAADRF